MFYLSIAGLQEAIDEAYNRAVRDATDTVFEGTLSAEELSQIIDKEQINKEALELILTYEP